MFFEGCERDEQSHTDVAAVIAIIFSEIGIVWIDEVICTLARPLASSRRVIRAVDASTTITTIIIIQNLTTTTATATANTATAASV